MKRELPYVVSQAQSKARKDKSLKDFLYSYLKEISLLNNPKDKLNFVRSEIDIILKEESSETLCLKGCHHCCFHPVAVSPMEIENIKEDNSAYDQNRLKKQKENLNDSSTIGYEDRACIYLNNGTCTIYEKRPLICRLTHVKSSPENCHLENEIANVVHLPVTKAALIVGAFYISHPDIDLIPNHL
jgi:Fe-S-cluster containining protein